MELTHKIMGATLHPCTSSRVQVRAVRIYQHSQPHYNSGTITLSMAPPWPPTSPYLAVRTGKLSLPLDMGTLYTPDGKERGRFPLSCTLGPKPSQHRERYWSLRDETFNRALCASFITSPGFANCLGESNKCLWFFKKNIQFCNQKIRETNEDKWNQAWKQISCE